MRCGAPRHGSARPVVLELSIAKTEQTIVTCCVHLETGDDSHDVTLQDVRAHRLKYKLDVICVCRAGEVRVDVLGAVRDSVDEHLGNELSSLFIVSFWACQGGRGRNGEEGGGGGEGGGGRVGQAMNCTPTHPPKTHHCILENSLLGVRSLSSPPTGPSCSERG